MSVQVVTAEGLPDVVRRRTDLAESLTVAQIVDRAFPGASEALLERLRVTLSHGDAITVIPRSHWRHVRPRKGVVVLQVTPGALIFQAAALLTHSIGLVAFDMGIRLSAFAVNAVFAGSALAVGALANAALNSLIPKPSTPEKGEEGYRIGGFRNEVAPGQPVPWPVGRIRVAPLFASQPYTEVIGDDQYVRALFLFGYGRLDLSDLKIGDVPIADLPDVEVEIREGQDTDADVTLTPCQVLEESVSIELAGPQPVLDQAGNEIVGQSEDQPFVLSTSFGATRAALVFQWPSGLYRLGDKGNTRETTVSIRIRQRPIGGTWSNVTDLTFEEAKLEPIWRQYSWTLPYRGRWEIEVTKLTKDERAQTNNRTYLMALQSIRPEYPINMDKPLALAALKVKASEMLNGALDQFNAVAQRYVPVWNGSDWVEGLSRNAASAFLAALQGNHHPNPVDDAGIDWEVMQDWWLFCEEKGLKYDRDHRSWTSFGEMLVDIAAAGRASPRHDGARWGVVIERPQAVAVDHVTPRNSWDFEGTRAYLDPPEGVRVRFQDETSGWTDAEMILPWPGHTGPINLVEEWRVAGKTNPDELAREIYRRMLEIIHQLDRYFVMQDGAARVATRGDKVLLTHDVLTEITTAARVVSSSGGTVVLDAEVHMDAGQRYALRWTLFDEDDTIGSSQVVPVSTMPGTTRTLHLGAADGPPVDALAIFGPAEEEVIACRVVGVEPGADFSSRLILTAEAAEVEALTDAYTPPIWNSAVGSAVPEVLPGAPEFAGVSTEAAEGVYGAAGRILRVGAAMPQNDPSTVDLIEVEHRIVGAGSWSGASIPGTSGSVGLSYDLGADVEIRLAARTPGGQPGPWSAIVTVEVGVGEGALAQVPDTAGISANGGLGHCLVTLALSDPQTGEVEIFRTPQGQSVDTATHAIGIAPINSGTTVSWIDGDAAQADQVTDGDMTNAAAWTAGGGWSVGSGVADHVPGAASTLSQGQTLTAGSTYRGRISVTGRTAGTVTVQLAGGTVVAAPAIAADGDVPFSLTAATGNDRIEIVADADFDGSITQLILFPQSPAAAPQGDFDYRFAAVNADGIASALSSPITATII